MSAAANRTASIREVRSCLPREFVASLHELLPQHLCERTLRGMAARRPTTLRANTLRSSAAEVMRWLSDRDLKYRRPDWSREAFVLAELRERDVQAWDLYTGGRIYLQSLSSMIPALALAPRPGERVLDLAAAPGSKTTQMAALMENRGAIVANELSAIRAERLAYNVRMQGCSIVEIRRGRGEKLGAECPDSFDRVLVDAPCSGEGRFLAGSPATSRAWRPRLVTECARLQRQLLASAARALKPGGVLVYSTCTLNIEENEGMVQWAIANLPLSVEPVRVRPPGSIDGLLAGPAGRTFDPPVGRALRILPDRDYEGFFVCRMRKGV